MDLTEQAVWYSMAQFIRCSRGLYNDRAYDFLPDILREADTDSCVHVAMRSVAITNLANRSSTSGMTELVLFEQMQALSRVRMALEDGEAQVKDDTLVAVWLLGIREVRWPFMMCPQSC
jgi:hypothetical protein